MTIDPSAVLTSAGEGIRETLRRLLPRRSDLAGMLRDKRRNILAGTTVAVVALPLALAFGVSSGLGAQAGLVTAVIAGTIAAILGGSNLQVSGPTGAMTVVLIPIVAQHGARGVLVTGLLAGAMLIGLAVARLGRYVRYLPSPLIEGFTLGIAWVIALQQVPHALGVGEAHGERVWVQAAHAVESFVSGPTIAPLAIAIGVTVMILLGSRRYPRLPVSLLAVAAVSLANLWGNWGAPVIGDIPRGLPRPSAGFFSWGLLQDVAPAAVAVAALAALESLLCATVADAMSVKENHDPDRELFGQGVANLAVPFFGGVPATAAIARTAVCVRAGATSRLAAVVHSVAILAVVLVASPLVAHVPLAALAGVLFATTLRMVERASIVALLRATRGDRWTLILTFLVTISVDLVTAVVVGMVVAGVLALQAVARAARLDRVPLEQGEYSADEHQLLTDHIVAYRLDGPLFFAAAHQFLLELTSISDVRVVILRLSRVSTMDATGARVLGDAVSRLERRGIIVLLSGIAADHDEMLASLGVAEHLRREGKIFPHTPAAIAAAREMIADHLDHARRAHANSMADGS